jgi:hypothetical protein
LLKCWVNFYKTIYIISQKTVIFSLTIAYKLNLEAGISGLVMWDLWWTKWHWGRFSQGTSVSLANLHSTDFSTVTITYHPGLVQDANSGCSTLQSHRTNKKKIFRSRDSAVGIATGY